MRFVGQDVEGERMEIMELNGILTITSLFMHYSGTPYNL